MGAEIQKTRPAIIISDNSIGKLPLKVIVPITDWKDKYDIAPWITKLEPSSQNNLNKISAIDCFQIRCVSENRFVKKIGIIDLETLESIKISISLVIGIQASH